MDEFSIEYEFDYLVPTDARGRPLYRDGMMLSGTAVLASNGDGDFYVRDIFIDGEKIARHSNLGGNGFEGLLFKMVSDALYHNKGASDTWRDAYHDSGEPITPVYSTLNHDAQGLSGVAA